MACRVTPVLSAPSPKVAGTLSPASPKQPTRFVAMVDPAKCVACGVCVPVCAAGAITLADVAAINPDRCTGCGECVAQCPQDALRLQPA
jgi:ferredoxin